MNFWYAQSQAQVPVGQMPYPVPPPPQAVHAQSSTQTVPKLSKLVKEARLLGCQTFSGTADAIVAKNWIKKVSDIMIDMELDDTYKLRVATRLLDQSAATWWENLKLRTSVPITWECLYGSSMNNITLIFTETRSDRSFLDSSSGERL